MMGSYTLFSFFTDPVLRDPTIGCMLMCLSAGLVGVIVFLRKQSLIGETLSHAAYPGVILGAILASLLVEHDEHDIMHSLFILGGAFVTALLGLSCLNWLEKRMRVPADAALCFVLSTFFGVGITLASEAQFSFTAIYRRALTYLYGQAATMTSVHVWIYGCLSLLILLLIALFYKEIKLITFDRQYAKSVGIPVRLIDTLFLFLVALAVVIGIRSVGVVLMSAMLIAPAAAARQLTHRLSLVFLLSAIFALLAGFFGNYFSVFFYTTHALALPTGPMIVIVATAICLLSLLFAPERGAIPRLLRLIRFRYECLMDNLLKDLWKGKEGGARISYPSLLHRFILWRMAWNGWIIKKDSGLYELTSEGRLRGARIVRLHRLWELYLVDHLGAGIERVHRSAEEMEHILTPEIEQELTYLLKDPKLDPHQQPIPPKER